MTHCNPSVSTGSNNGWLQSGPRNRHTVPLAGTMEINVHCYSFFGILSKMPPCQPFDPFTASSVKLTFLDNAKKRHSSKPFATGLSTLSLCRSSDVVEAARPILDALSAEIATQARALVEGQMGQQADDMDAVCISGSSQKVKLSLLYPFTLGAVLGLRVLAHQNAADQREFSAPGTTCDRGVVTISFVAPNQHESRASGSSRGQGKRELHMMVRCYACRFISVCAMCNCSTHHRTASSFHTRVPIFVL